MRNAGTESHLLAYCCLWEYTFLEASLHIYMPDLEGCSHKVPYYILTFQ